MRDNKYLSFLFSIQHFKWNFNLYLFRNSLLVDENFRKALEHFKHLVGVSIYIYRYIFYL